MPNARSQQRRENQQFRTHDASLIANARTLRREMTDVERLLWAKLSRNQTQHRFRRQHPIGHYVVDFICINQKLIIELDGGQHNAAIDAERTADLQQLGYRILRFWNNDVIENLEGVYDTIITALNTSSPPTVRHEGLHPS